MKIKFNERHLLPGALRIADVRLASHLELLGKCLLYITVVPSVVVATMTTAYYFPTMPTGVI
ncbi:MAG: hypothetical protein AAFY99_14175 [Pseudomonadota bacterium]